MKRNSSRLVCSVCGFPLLAAAKSKRCAFCAGPMRTRTLDAPNVIRERLKEHRERTLPILSGMRKEGIRVIRINAEPLPYRVFGEIVRKLRWGSGRS